MAIPCIGNETGNDEVGICITRHVRHVESRIERSDIVQSERTAGDRRIHCRGRRASHRHCAVQVITELGRTVVSHRCAIQSDGTQCRQMSSGYDHTAVNDDRR